MKSKSQIKGGLYTIIEVNSPKSAMVNTENS